MELLNENTSVDAPSTVPLKMKSEEVSSTFKKKKPKNQLPKSDDVAIIISNDEKSGGTQGIILLT